MTRLSISEARRRLPQLVRQVNQDRGSVVQITVRGEIVAELRAALPEPEPGAAARALLELARKLPEPRRRGQPTDVSTARTTSMAGAAEPRAALPKRVFCNHLMLLGCPRTGACSG